MKSILRTVILCVLLAVMVGGCGDGGGDATTAPAPSCEDGTYDDDGDSSTPCVAWSSCVAGEFVSQAGTSITDRDCEQCAPGTYSESPNSSVCVPEGQCPAGTVQSAPGTDVSPPECQPCEAGMFCAGGEEPAVECAPGTWDEDSNPASVCTSWTDCVAGEYVTTPGSTIEDRACGECNAGMFSEVTNAVSCAAWTDCAAGEYETAAGTARAIGPARHARRANTVRQRTQRAVRP